MISAGSEIAHQDGIDRKPVLQMDNFTHVCETDSVTRAWHQLIYPSSLDPSWLPFNYFSHEFCRTSQGQSFSIVTAMNDPRHKVPYWRCGQGRQWRGIGTENEREYSRGLQSYETVSTHAFCCERGPTRDMARAGIE